MFGVERMKHDEKEDTFVAGIFGETQEEFMAKVIDIGDGVTIDLNDAGGLPVMVSRDGWMTLEDAKELQGTDRQSNCDG